jgi:hypothetical protein
VGLDIDVAGIDCRIVDESELGLRRDCLVIDGFSCRTRRFSRCRTERCQEQTKYGCPDAVIPVHQTFLL